MATSPQNTISFPRGNINSLTCVISDVFLGVCTLRYGIVLHKCSWICLFRLTSCLGELCTLRLTSLPHFSWSRKLDFYFFDTISNFRRSWGTVQEKPVYPFIHVHRLSAFCLICSLLPPPRARVYLYPHVRACIDTTVILHHLRLHACCCEQE